MTEPLYSPYDGLPFAKHELEEAMSRIYDELLDFFYTSEFQSVWLHLKSLPGVKRYAFIKDVILDIDVLKKDWGVEVPDGILIQRSSFGDRRPTLFCLKKYLPKKFHCVWENANLTFDEMYDDDKVSRDPKIAWREPIKPDVQSLLIGAGLPLEEVPQKFLQNIVSS